MVLVKTDDLGKFAWMLFLADFEEYIFKLI